MRVFQAPIEIAGQMGLLAQGLQALGHHVSSYNTESNYLDYKKNIENVSVDQLRTIFETCKTQFDVFHFHYGQGFTSDDAEFRYASEHGKVAIMQYWGNDVRTEHIAVQNNPYAKRIGEFLDETVAKERLTVHSHYFPACIVQDFEVAPYVAAYFNRVYVLPIAIDLEGIEPQYPRDSVEEPLILHAPTQPYFKGTSYIEETLEQLREDGFRFHYQKIHGMAHDEAIQQYGAADIVIDQILCGSHGLFAVEAMAYGKPVISYIREDLIPRFPEHVPIVSANPDTLYHAVKQLFIHRDNWSELGRQGRQYVERVHALPVVAHALDWIYRREALLRSHAPSHQLPPSVIQVHGQRVTSYPIHPRTRAVNFEQRLLDTSLCEES